MKNLIKSFLTFNIILFILIFKPTKIFAQEVECPPNWEYHTFDIVVNCVTFPCTLKVYVCCYFDWINLYLHVKIKKIEFNNVPWACYGCIYYLNWNYFRTIIEQMVKDKICSEGWCGVFDIPLCENPVPLIVKFYYSQCYFWENKKNQFNEFLLYLVECGNNEIECVHTIQICRTPPPNCQIQVLRDEWETIIPAGCSLEEPQLPPPGKTWDEYWRTKCFAKPCQP